MADELLERDLARRRLLGWAPACAPIEPGVDLGRDLVLETRPDGTVDLARVDGMDALEQSLTIGLTTALGSDLFNTDFGFDGLNALVEETSAMLVRERVRISVIQLLRKDPRVRRIADVNLNGGEQEEPPTPGSRVLDVRVVFETVAEEQATLQLGKVIPRG
jgi:phage baseplate assembly protein W